MKYPITPFFKYDANEALHLSKEERDHIYSLLNKIAEEYEGSIDTHTQEIIIGSISMLLKYAQRYYDRQFFTRKNVNQDILGRFEKLLQNTFDSNETLESGIPTVKELGEIMGMSSHYLSELLKKETGQSAKSHLQSHIIAKAKNLLLSSNNSVSEVAYLLGFEYPQHFSKLFKLKTGLSPKEYKKKHLKPISFVSVKVKDEHHYRKQIRIKKKTYKNQDIFKSTVLRRLQK